MKKRKLEKLLRIHFYFTRKSEIPLINPFTAVKWNTSELAFTRLYLFDFSYSVMEKKTREIYAR